MKKQIVHQPKGTCSRAIEVNLNDDGVIESVRFLGGCAGNTAGISTLVVGMKAQDVIDRLKGTRCGFRPTSGPDQLAQALEKAMAD